MEITTTIICKNSKCSRSLKVPTNKGTLRITCPYCKNIFLWQPTSTQELDFRCSKTGKPFKAIFARENPNHKFRITQITGSVSGQTSTASINTTVSKSASKTQMVEINEFDFSGFYCPHCGYNKSRHFVQCGACKEYVCGGRIIELSDTVATFQCTDSCGNSGIIQSTLSSINAKSSEQKNLPGSNHNQLGNKTRPELGNKK